MRLINEQYINNAETLRIRTEVDEDAEHPRKGDMMEPISAFVAKHSRYTLGDEDAMSDLADALRDILTDCASLDDDMIECPSCHGDDVYGDEGHPGQVGVCRECQGDGQIENSHYINTSDGPSLYKGLAALDPDETRIFRLPVYIFDHSGIALATTPFSCPWDSGQVGFIWMTKDTAERELGDHSTIESLREAAHRYMKGEIETLSQYVEGQVYGFICERYVGPEGDDKDTDDDDNWEETDSCWGFFGMDVIENGMFEHWEDRYIDAFCEAEGITREQLEAEKEAWIKKAHGDTAEAE